MLGLTFTRKAAGQLLRRVRTRLARLAGAGLVPGGLTPRPTSTRPSVSTYHAFAGTLLREHGLLLPVEPDTRLLSETELWQLAFRVVCEHPGDLDTEKTPAAVTAMVLRLAGQLAEHLVDTEQLRDTHLELERLVHTLPAGPYQRDRGPSQWLLRMLATQTERTELVPLDRCAARADAARQGDGLRHADGRGGPAGVGVPAGRRRSCGSATGWCCSTSTRTPATRSGSRCRRCSAAESTTTWR